MEWRLCMEAGLGTRKPCSTFTILPAPAVFQSLETAPLVWRAPGKAPGSSLSLLGWAVSDTAGNMLCLQLLHLLYSMRSSSSKEPLGTFFPVFQPLCKECSLHICGQYSHWGSPMLCTEIQAIACCCSDPSGAHPRTTLALLGLETRVQ